MTRASRRPATTWTPCCKKLGTGLFVVELMGQGVNYVTGRLFARRQRLLGENGKIAFPVHEITIAGNLGDMLKGIEAVALMPTATAPRPWAPSWSTA